MVERFGFLLISLAVRFRGLSFAVGLHLPYKVCIKKYFYYIYNFTRTILLSLSFFRSRALAIYLCFLTLLLFAHRKKTKPYTRICECMCVCLSRSKGTGFLTKRYRFVCSQQRLLLIFLRSFLSFSIFILDSFWKRNGLEYMFI